MSDFLAPPLIKKVASGEKTHKDLTRAEAYWIMGEALAGRLSDLQVGALLAALRLKGESVDELAGFLQAVAETVTPVDVPNLPGPVVAHCGVTSGKSHSFLAAPAASILATAAGVRIAVCGRLGNETRFPTTDLEVFRALGLRTDLPPSAAAERLAETGLAVIEQRRYHHALARLSDMRVPLGMRTVAQSVEKFAFPVRPTAAIASAFHINYLRRLAEAVGQVFDFPFLLLQERDGSTDPMPINPVKGFRISGGAIAECQISAADAELPKQEVGSLPALDAATTAEYTRQLLRGELGGPHRTMLLYSTALLVHLGFPDRSLASCAQLSAELLDDGAGRQALALVIAQPVG